MNEIYSIYKKTASLNNVIMGYFTNQLSEFHMFLYLMTFELCQDAKLAGYFVQKLSK
jgi:hypothetical protein